MAYFCARAPHRHNAAAMLVVSGLCDITRMGHNYGGIVPMRGALDVCNFRSPAGICTFGELVFSFIGW